MQTMIINLTFHGIGTPKECIPANEVPMWVMEVPFSKMLEAVKNKVNVNLTFDDGNASDAEIALPHLKRLGLKAKFFIVAGRRKNPNYVSDAQIRELHAAGMEIGVHGMHHVPWRKLSDANLHEELVISRKILEDVLGEKVLSAACPFGEYDRRVLSFLRKEGYQHVFTSDRGEAEQGRWLQARNTIRHNDSTETVESMLQEMSMVKRIRQRLKMKVKAWR